MDLSWITNPEAWKAIGLSIASRGVWAAGAFALAGGFGAFARDRRKFSGRWRLRIRWSPDYANTLFGSNVPDPHSVGNVSMTFGVGEHKNQYWGLAYFQLKAGTQQYAQLCVEFHDVKVRRRIFSKEFPWMFLVSSNKCSTARIQAS